MAKFEDKTTDFRCKKANLIFASCEKKSGSREKHIPLKCWMTISYAHY